MSDTSRAAIRDLRTALWKQIRSVIAFPTRSLPSKIVFFVFVTALVASLVVAWVSAQSIESFLREKIDQKFPEILHSTTERLELWYAQRQLDVQIFARSSTIQQNLGRLGEGQRGERAHDEIEQYLSYVLERFPQYRSLFLLDLKGQWKLGVGDEFALPEAVRGVLGDVTTSTVGSVLRIDAERIQLVSSPIVDSAGRLASLHAVLDVATPEAQLQRDGLTEQGAIFVIAGGEIVMQTTMNAERGRYTRPLPVRGALPAVELYQHASGEEMLGSAVRFPRFGWTIAVEEPYAELFAPAAAIARKILLFNVAIVLFFCSIAGLLARSIARPIQGLSAAALRVAEGESDVTFPAHGADEIGVLGRIFNEMMERLHHNRVELDENQLEIEDANSRLIAQNRELQRVNEVFHQLSITDDLTKLHNHRFFQDHLPHEMKRAARTGEPLCLVLIDIDDFKRLNDRHGHSVGDAVLRRAADVMNQVVREMDLLARYGGEEFALLASQTNLEGAAALAEKVRLAISQARFPIVTLEGPDELSITVSIGVAKFRGDERAFFNEADRALYRAKDAGKDCVVLSEEADSR